MRYPACSYHSYREVITKTLPDHLKRIVILLAVLIVLGPSSGSTGDTQNSAEISSSPAAASTSRTITYYGNQTITVPWKINRIACGWNAQNSVIAMLGYGDKIVATTDMIKASPIFTKFEPTIKDAVICFISSGELNMEALLSVRPELAFMSIASGARRLQAMGIAVASLKANSMKNLVERALITGQILGDDAYQRARKYVDYYNENVRKVTGKISKIPQEQRVKVYHSLGNPLMTCGSPSLVQDWMDLAGAINVAENWKLIKTGMMSLGNANLEQIIAADPAVIVCMRAEHAQAINTDARWGVIRAVKDGKVYINPSGMFPWCRETSEEALQFLWLAKTIYPTHFQDVDMARETKRFYKQFYGYDLSDDDVRTFLYPQ